MTDFSIKDQCEKCGAKEELDGVLWPYYSDFGSLIIEQATLCKECMKEAKEFFKERKNAH